VIFLYSCRDFTSFAPVHFTSKWAVMMAEGAEIPVTATHVGELAYEVELGIEVALKDLF
jgi:hypothetical protein